MKTVPPDMLTEMTRRLVETFQPEQIILFGSQAWGTPTDDSDVDVLVIVSHSELSEVRQSARGERALRGLPIPTDILVKTRAEVERYRGIRVSLVGQILQRGRVLYG